MKYTYEIFEAVSKAKTRAAKKDILLENKDEWAMKDLLKGTFDDSLEFLLPKGEVPYTACEEHNAPSNWKKQHKQLKFFVPGGPGTQMPAFKREKIFFGILESIHPEDAKLVVKMVNKDKTLATGLTPKLVKEVFPNLI